ALASIVFLRLHPKPLRHTPSYEFTTSFGGVCWGLVVGMSRQHLIYRQNHPGQFVRIVQSRAGVIALLQRVTLGFVLVVVMKPLSKQVVVIFLPLVYKLVPVDLRKLWQPPLHSLKPPKHEGIPVDENGQSWDVSVTARFISYASIGWTVVDLAPLMFQMLGFSIPWGLS
ncbi:MAG: Sphingosine-1-phosphate phosphatase, partial [Trebouxia sp. A1-2]